MLLLLAGNGGKPFAYVNIDLGTNAKFRQIDARFDGETAARENAALVMRLKIVHIGPGAVHFRADAVTGAMEEVLGITALFDEAAHGIVHLEASDGRVLAYAVDDKL